MFCLTNIFARQRGATLLMISYNVFSVIGFISSSPKARFMRSCAILFAGAPTPEYHKHQSTLYIEERRSIGQFRRGQTHYVLFANRTHTPTQNLQSQLQLPMVFGFSAGQTTGICIFRAITPSQVCSW